MSKFLALKVKLTEEIKKKLKELPEDFIIYDGSEEKHKIPHITIVPPRKTFDLEDWKEKIEGKVEEEKEKWLERGRRKKKDE